MHRRFLSAVMLLIIVILLVGCSHKDTVIGTWGGTHTSSAGFDVKETWQFSSDGKNTVTLSYLGGPHNGVTVHYTVDYTVNGTTMTQAIQTMSEPGRTVTVPHPVTSTFQYTLTGDTLTIDGSGVHHLILTRQGAA